MTATDAAPGAPPAAAEPEIEKGVAEPAASADQGRGAARARACRLVAVAATTAAVVAAAVTAAVVLTRPRPPPPQRPAPHAVAGHHVPDRYEVVERDDAQVSADGEVRLYFVGGSNVVWQTWPDQLHAYLRKLNYTVATGNYSHADRLSPEKAPVCDDEAEFRGLSTPRIGRPGWGSWGFAYDSREDCAAASFVGEATGGFPFRSIAGHPVSCLNGWACTPGKEQSRQLVRPSDVAEDASEADVVVLSTWFNDFKQQYCDYKCYNGTVLEPAEIAPVTVANLLRLIRAVHAENPAAFVLVMALYPDASRSLVVEDTLDTIAAINAQVKEGLRAEPNVAFVDFDLAPGQDMFQVKPPGHPNCRGDRIMATQVMRTLFDRGVLGRSLALPEGDLARECLRAESCGAIVEKACCQAAASCRVDPDGVCVAYSAGEGSL